MMSSREKSLEMIFSGNLRKLMERDQVKQKDLAQALGVVQGAVSAWVNGRTPDFPNQQKLARYFKVTVAELFTEPPAQAGAGGRAKSGADQEGGRQKPEPTEVKE